MPGSNIAERIVIIAPVGRDAAAIAELLDGQGFQTAACHGAAEGRERVIQGAGALLLTEEVLESGEVSQLLEALKAQPAWSELPVILLTGGGESKARKLLDVAALAAGSVTLLERPMSSATLLRSVEVALHSRRRQYQVRDLLEEQQRKRAELEEVRARVDRNMAALMRMHELSGKSFSAEGLDGLLREIMEAAVAIASAERGTLHLLEGDSPRIVAHHGHTAPFLEFFAAAENRVSVCGEAMKRRERVVVPDVEESPILSGTASLAILREAGVRAEQSTPLMSRTGVLLGILATQWGRPYRPDEHDLWRIDLLARQGADMIEHAQAEVALRESEERFRALAEHIPQLAWMANEQGWIFWYNRRWFDYTGTTLEAMQGWGWQAVHHPEHLERVTGSWKKRLESGEPWEDTFPLRGKTGGYRWFLSRAFPLRDANGRITRWFGTNTDITAQKDFEAELERLVAERTADLRATNEQLETFVYSIAHDLRAPLRSMLGYSQILLDDHAPTLQEPAQQMLKRIQTSSEFMDKLLLDLLAFGRAARVEMELGPVEIQNAWESALFQCAAQIEQTGAQVETVRPLPRAHAHEATLAQCLANLLSNSLKFVAPGVQPSIRFWAEDRGDRVRLWVEDNGIGIPLRFQEKVFRVFERLQGARYPGTGIGLSIVRKGVERMGGSVGLESEPGKGSRFWLELQMPGGNSN